MLTSKKHQLTDDEFVQKIRKQLNSSRRIGIFLSIFYFAAFIAFCVFCQKLIESFRGLSQHSDSFNPGLALGFTTGLIIAFVLFKLAKLLAEAVMMAAGVHFSRIAKLLVTYYDLAHERTHNTTTVA